MCMCCCVGQMCLSDVLMYSVAAIIIYFSSMNKLYPSGSLLL